MVLATDDTEASGWITYGANRDADATPDVGEVRALYVHPRWWGAGVGSDLLELALRDLPAMGYRQATLWSFALNARANAFYERHGFERDGAERPSKFFGGLLEVRYRRKVG